MSRKNSYKRKIVIKSGCHSASFIIQELGCPIFFLIDFDMLVENIKKLRQKNQDYLTRSLQKFSRILNWKVNPWHVIRAMSFRHCEYSGGVIFFSGLVNFGFSDLAFNPCYITAFAKFTIKILLINAALCCFLRFSRKL